MSDSDGKRLVIDLESPDIISKKSKMLTLEAADLVPKPTVVHSSTNPRKVLHKSVRKHSPSKRRLSTLQSGSAKKPKLSKTTTPTVGPLSELLVSGVETHRSDDKHIDKRTKDNPSSTMSHMTCQIPRSDAAASVDPGPDPSNSEPPHVDLESSSSVLDENEDVSDVADTESSSWHPSEEQEDDDEDEPLHRSRRLSSGSHSRTLDRKSSRQIHKNRRERIRSSTEENTKKFSLSVNTDDSPGSDDYCWICHKVGRMVICSCCPRVYHPSCLCLSEFPDVWLCPECQDLTVAECLLHRPRNWRDITSAQVQRMLYFLIDRLAMQSWAEHFREPVDTQKVAGYASIVFYPMDLRTLYLRNKNGRYASPQAFLHDFRWIVHNCIVFNGVNSALTNQVRLLNRTCLRELALMKACPKCYLNRVPALRLLPSTTEVLPLLTNQEWLTSSNETLGLAAPQPLGTPNVPRSSVSSDDGSLDHWWFCRLCDDVHPLVWVRLQHYPLWPAKVMAVDGDSLLVMFFGDYEVTLAPTGSAQLHSENRANNPSFLTKANGAIGLPALEPITSPASVGASSTRTPTPPPPPISPVSVCGRSSKGLLTDSGVDTNYRQAVAELSYHVYLIQQRYPKFKLPESSLEYSKKHVNRFYAVCRDSTQVKGNPTKDQVQFPLLVNTHPSVCMEPITSDTNVNPLSNRQCNFAADRPTEAYPEPLLSRVAASIRDTAGNNAMATVAHESEAARVEYLDPKHTPVLNSPQAGNDASSTTNAHDLLPGPLHPIPASAKEECNSSDEVHSLLQRFRSQFDEILVNLEEKWQLSRKDASGVDGRCVSPILGSLTIEQGAQTVAPHLTDSFVQKSEESQYPDGVTTATSGVQRNSTGSLNALQAAIMEGEIDRLDRENRRLNLLLAFTRAEMSWEMRHRIMELRRVWNFELSSILDAASKIWEQDLIRIVDAVKRKQWCAYCGRLAYYYCCWNTCYCNNVCQSKHWASHINVCVQARVQTVTSTGHTDSESHLRPHHHNPPQQQPSAPLSSPLVGNHLSSSANAGRWSMTSGS